MPQPTDLNNNCLSVSHLSYSIDNKKLINDISFSLPTAKKVALVGLNGAGKSSLIKLLVGEYQTLNGEITFSSKHDTNQTNHYKPYELAFKGLMGYQACSMQALDNITSKEYLQLCCMLKDIGTSSSEKQIELVVDVWNLSYIINKPMHQLSQGNLQKLALAQVFLSQPTFLFLDEPTQALDPLEQKRFIDNLNNLSCHQLCLFSSHHISETVESADLVLMLHKGRLIALLDIEAIDEFWFISNLALEQLQPSLLTEQSIELVSKKNKKLYRLKGGTEILWEKTLNKLKLVDPDFKSLGNSAQSLMPLFAELANESF